MASISTARKLAVARNILWKRARNSRLAAAFRAGAGAVWRSLSSVVRRLWHEVTGFIFLCFAAIGAAAGVREYHRLGAPERPARLAAAIAFTAIFAWFGVTSFLRARKVQRHR